MANKSTFVAVRLREPEIAALDSVRRNVNGETLNRSEMIRLLIVREHVKRSTGAQANIKTAMVSSDFRTGRPSDTNQPPPLPPPGRRRARKHDGKSAPVPLPTAAEASTA